MPKIRVAIADDHAIVRDGIRALLSVAADVEVVGEAADGSAAIALAARAEARRPAARHRDARSRRSRGRGRDSPRRRPR